MNIERAKEIIESKGIYDVEYQGKSIWIHGIDLKRNTAEIHGIYNDSFKMIVDVNELEETITS